MKRVSIIILSFIVGKTEMMYLYCFRCILFSYREILHGGGFWECMEMLLLNLAKIIESDKREIDGKVKFKVRD